MNHPRLNRRQKGFTLIELLAVIVIAGTLSAVALPRIADMSRDANDAALQSIKGAVNTASALNFVSWTATRKGVKTAGLSCSAAVGALLMDGVPDGYSVAANVVGETGITPCAVTQSATQQSTEIRIRATL